MTEANKTKAQLQAEVASLERSVAALKASISQGTQTTETLEKIAHEWRTTFDSMSDAVCLVDLSGQILRCNKAMRDMLGKSWAEIVGHNCCQLMHGASTPIDQCPLVRLRDTGMRECTTLEVNGRLIRVVADLLRDENSEVTQAVHIMTDVTESVQSEKALRSAEAGFQRILNNTGDGVVVLDEDGVVRYANPAVGILLGRAVDEIVGVTFGFPLVAGETTEIDLISRDKTAVVAEMRATETVWRGGRAFVASIRDISERKLLEIERERINRALVMISECNQALVRITEETELLSGICQLIVTVGGYKLAWVGYAEDDEEKSVRPVAWAGDDDYIRRVNVTWADVGRGRGPVGTCIRERRSVTVQNVETDESFRPWRDAAIQCGYGSVISFPLIRDEKAFGALSIYASGADAFSEGEVNLLTELAGDMAYGLTALRIRAENEQATKRIEALARFADENPNPVMRITPEGVLLYANNASAPVLAVLNCETGQPLPEDWHGLVATALQSGENTVVNIPCGDRFYEFVFAPITEAGYVNVYGRDITTRRRAEQALQ